MFPYNTEEWDFMSHSFIAYKYSITGVLSTNVNTYFACVYILFFQQSLR
jgi:hypothetical protein